MPPAIRQLTFLQKLGLSCGIFVFRILSLTLRVKFSPAMRGVLGNSPRQHLFLLWHNRLALALIAFSKIKTPLPLTGLVSASGDGAMLAYLMRAFGIRTARGSSSRRSVEGARELLQALDDERNIVIPPDGPRGPRYQVKEGSAAIAADYAKGVFVVGLVCSRFWQFHSWDRFILPRPFSTITVDMQKIEGAGALTKERLQEKLLAMNP